MKMAVFIFALAYALAAHVDAAQNINVPLTVTITKSNVTFDGSYAKHVGIALIPGEHKAVLCVSIIFIFPALKVYLEHLRLFVVVCIILSGSAFLVRF